MRSEYLNWNNGAVISCAFASHLVKKFIANEKRNNFYIYNNVSATTSATTKVQSKNETATTATA